MADPSESFDDRYRPFAAFDEWASTAVADDVWLAYVERLTAVRAAHPSVVVDVDEKSLRKAAYHTGALEGLHPADRGVTLTIVTAEAWRDALALEAGDETVQHVDAALQAFDLVLDIATNHRPLTESLIRQLHVVATSAQSTYDVVVELGGGHVRQQQKLPKGEYKSSPNHVVQADGSIHAYAPVQETQHEMRRLLDEISTEPFAASHPAVQAAYVHHGFATVHPFADGNGRVSRLLASLYLLRAVSIPLVIYEDEKAQYLTALRAADAGDHAAFVRFVFDRAIDAMGWAADEVIGGGTLAVRDSPGLDAEFVAARRSAAMRLGDVLNETIDSVSRTVGVWRDSSWHNGIAPHEALRTSDGRTSAGFVTPRRMSLTSQSLLFTTIRTAYVVMSLVDTPFPLGIVVGERVFDVRDSDIIPEVTTGLTVRLEAFCRAVVRSMIDELETAIATRN